MKEKNNITEVLEGVERGESAKTRQNQEMFCTKAIQD